MTINGTLVISKTPPLIAKEGVVWIDTSTQIPRIKYFSGGGYIPLNDTPDLPTIPEAPTWDSLEGKPEVIASGETQEEARSAIGAGTGNSNLELGTTSSTAKAGNYQPTWAQVTGKPTTFEPSAHDHAWEDITDKPTTFEPVIGTTATTAKAGNYVPTWAEVTSKPTTFTPSEHTHAWADITAKPEVIASGATQAEARTAIGAGTGNSNLEIGTTASTAKAGNYQPTWAQVTGKPSTFAPEIGSTATTAAAGNHNHAVTAHSESGLVAASNIQALAQALSTRIKALEDAQPDPEG